LHQLTSGSGGDNRYWDDTLQAIIQHTLQLLETTKPKEQISLVDIVQTLHDDNLATKLCDDVDALLEAKKQDHKISEKEWGTLTDSSSTIRHLWIALNANTKATLRAIIAQTLEPITQNPKLQEIFCQNTTVSFKDVINNGKLIIHTPTGEPTADRIIQTCLKIDFQKWAKRRCGPSAAAYDLNTTRPLLFFCEDFSRILTLGNEGDEAFASIARFAQVIQIVSFQNISNLLQNQNPDRAQELLQNISIWVACHSTDQKTKTWLDAKSPVNIYELKKTTTQTEAIVAHPNGSAPDTQNHCTKTTLPFFTTSPQEEESLLARFLAATSSLYLQTKPETQQLSLTSEETELVNLIETTRKGIVSPFAYLFPKDQTNRPSYPMLEDLEESLPTFSPEKTLQWASINTNPTIFERLKESILDPQNKLPKDLRATLETLDNQKLQRVFQTILKKGTPR
jgi:hypothetical protein